MRKLLVIGVIALLAILTVALEMNSLNQKQAPQGLDRWTNEMIVQSIVRNRPSLIRDGRPVIEVTHISMPEEGWYVAVIKSVNEEAVSVPVKVLLIERGDAEKNLEVILGPDSYFSENDMLSRNVPDSVILELKK